MCDSYICLNVLWLVRERAIAACHCLCKSSYNLPMNTLFSFFFLGRYTSLSSEYFFFMLGFGLWEDYHEVKLKVD
jgi:hypothetical protein